MFPPPPPFFPWMYEELERSRIAAAHEAAWRSWERDLWVRLCLGAGCLLGCAALFVWLFVVAILQS